jgi:hypothetical protein
MVCVPYASKMEALMKYLAFSVVLLTACFGAKANDGQIELPTQVAVGAYNYLLRFPAGEVKGHLDTMESEIKKAVEGNKETAKVKREIVEAVHKAVMEDGVVKLAIGLQQALQPAEQPQQQPQPHQEPEPKK